MNSEQKNFEERLKDRLHQEEMQYDTGAWESFQQLNTKSAISDIQQGESKSDKKNGRGVWVSIFLMLCLTSMVVFAGKWGYNQVYANNELTKETNPGKYDINTSVSSQITNTKTALTQFENQNVYDASNSIDEKPAQNHDNPSFEVNSLVDDRSTESIDENVINSKKEDDIANRQYEQNKKSIDLIGSTTQLSANSLNQTRQVGSESQLINKVVSNESNDLLPFINSQFNSHNEAVEDGKGKLNSQVNSSEDLLIENENLLSDRMVLIASIDNDLLGDLILPVNLNFDKEILIAPLKYKKNELYFGAGYVNKFSEFNLNNEAAGSSQRGPNYLSIGYFRKVSPSWSVGVEVNLSHLQNIPMSRLINDYHQTSTSFEYISGVMTHNFTDYLGTSFMLKFQPLGSRLGVYGGVNVAFAYNKSTSFKNDFQGQNEIIRELRVFHSGSTYYENLDFGLAAGASFKIWKGFEIEGRAVLGLPDVSDDYYWGEGRNTTTHYRLGLKFRIL